MNKIPVFFSVDDNYVPYLAVAIQSISETAKQDDFYQIYVLNEGLTGKNAKVLQQINYKNLSIEFIDVTEKIKTVKNLLIKTLRDYYTVSIFYRIFIASLFPDIKKAIYLDSDVVCVKSLSSLYKTDLQDNILGVVTDETVLGNKNFEYYVENVIGVEPQNYFNSGVLLMDLEKFRAEEIEQRFIDLIKRYNFDSVAPDQDYLNFLCKDKVLYLDGGWDKMPTEKNAELKLIHFNMFTKPWLTDVRYDGYFWRYALNTPFYELLKEKKSNYSQKMFKNDLLRCQALLKRAVEIADNEQITFNRIFGNGKESKCVQA